MVNTLIVSRDNNTNIVFEVDISNTLTQVGQITGTTGAWTFGPSSGGASTLTHLFQSGGNTFVQIKSTVANNNAALKITTTAGTAQDWWITLNGLLTNGSLEFYNATSNADFGFISTTGAWTLGSSTGGALEHTVRSNGNVTQLSITSTAANSDSALSLKSVGTGIPYVDFYRGGSSKWQAGVNANFGTDSFFLYNSASSAYMGGVTSAGSWQLGTKSGSQNTVHNFWGGGLATTHTVQVVSTTNSAGASTAAIGAGPDTTIAVGMMYDRGNGFNHLMYGATLRIGSNSGSPFASPYAPTLQTGSVTLAGAWVIGPSTVTVTSLPQQSIYGPVFIQGNISTGTGAYNLEVVDSAANDVLSVHGSGQIRVRTTNWGTGGTAIGVSASLLTTSPSSLRYKQNVAELVAEIDSSRVYDLHPVTFDYKIDNRHSFGYIAEEVETVLPCLVNHEDDGYGTMRPESVSYDHLAVLLLEEIKKLKARVDGYGIPS